MSIEQRLKELKLVLPAASKPLGTYVPGVLVGNLLFMSGCGPNLADGGFVSGKVGKDLSIEQGYDAARLVGLTMLANIRAVVGSLDCIERVVKILMVTLCCVDQIVSSINDRHPAGRSSCRTKSASCADNEAKLERNHCTHLA